MISLSLSLSIYIYIYISYIYIYIYICQRGALPKVAQRALAGQGQGVAGAGRGSQNIMGIFRCPPVRGPLVISLYVLL